MPAVKPVYLLKTLGTFYFMAFDTCIVKIMYTLTQSIINTAIIICPGASTFLVSEIRNTLAFLWHVDKGDGNGFIDVANDSVYKGARKDTLYLTAPPTSYTGNKYPIYCHTFK